MGSRKDTAGQNKANRAIEQITKQQEAIQAGEHKEVRSTPYGRSLGRGLEDTSKYSGNLKGAIERANFRNSVLGQNQDLNQLADPLGRSGIETDEYGRARNLGEYNVTPGGMQDSVRGTLGSRDISQLGSMIDSGNFANLNEQAATNRMFGFNPTKGMGILDSLKHGFTNPEAKRGFQKLGNVGKGIMNLMPGKALMSGLLNRIPGVNLPSQFSMTEIDPYNIGQGFGEDPSQFNMFSNPELEGMSENAIYSRLFNDLSPVKTGMLSQPYSSPAFDIHPPSQPYSSPAFDIHPPSVASMYPERRPEQPVTDNNRFMPYDMLQQGPLYGAGPFGPEDFVDQGFAENFNDVGQMNRYAQFHDDAPEWQKFIDPIHHPPAGGPLVANDPRIDQFIAGAPNVGVYPNNIGMPQNAMDAWNYSGEPTIGTTAGATQAGMDAKNQMAAYNQAKAMGVYGYGN